MQRFPGEKGPQLQGSLGGAGARQVVEKENRYLFDGLAAGRKHFFFSTPSMPIFGPVLMIQNLSARGEIHDSKINGGCAHDGGQR
jgi:hypothetical protein